MALREDSDWYCLLWLGIVILSAYYFSFFYFSMTVTIFLPMMLSSYSVNLTMLLLLPPILIFFFVGYLRPERSKAKPTVLAIGVTAALLYTIFAISLDSAFGGGLYLAIWGIGSSLLVAGALSISQPLDENISPGILDVSSLHYGPPPKEEPEVPVEEAPAEKDPVEEAPPTETSAAEEEPAPTTEPSPSTDEE